MIKEIFIGIDPDVDKSGFGMWNRVSKDLFITRYSFFDLYGIFKDLERKEDCMIVIEAGWLNKKANFRQMLKSGGKWVKASPRVKERMASSTGRNEEVGKKIVEMCVSLGIDYKLVKPTRSKTTREGFEKITGMQTKNQEEIDAAMLVIGY